MVHLGLGGQYVAEGGKAFPSSPEDVIVETKKVVSLFVFVCLVVEVLRHFVIK